MPGNFGLIMGRNGLEQSGMSTTKNSVPNFDTYRVKHVGAKPEFETKYYYKSVTV